MSFMKNHCPYKGEGGKLKKGENKIYWGAGRASEEDKNKSVPGTRV